MIGIFDSGVGGLSLLRELDHSLPEADFLYLSDSACFPYGTRPPEWIKDRAAAITRVLTGRGCSLVVAACNTATVAAIEHLRKKFPVPFVGIVPPVKPAAATSPEKPLAVLMTENTAEGSKYTDLVKTYAGDSVVAEVRLPLLAEVVEELGFTDPVQAERVVAEVRSRLGKSRSGWRLVLGCTHYVFLRPLLERGLGPEVEVLDPCSAVAAQVVRVCESRGITVIEGGARRYLTTGDPERFAWQVSELLGVQRPQVEKVELA
ncbi:MAG: glutamate racemase [Candidatus Glassbacteria bacterium]|nr:glutamate racemase [Candidatus Glassbacteria bacterium]